MSNPGKGQRVSTHPPTQRQHGLRPRSKLPAAHHHRCPAPPDRPQWPPTPAGVPPPSPAPFRRWGARPGEGEREGRAPRGTVRACTCSWLKTSIITMGQALAHLSCNQHTKTENWLHTVGPWPASCLPQLLHLVVVNGHHMAAQLVLLALPLLGLRGGEAARAELALWNSKHAAQTQGSVKEASTACKRAACGQLPGALHMHALG